jgi:RNA polymerase sigma-70 factor (ECF subfamily)
MSSSSTEPLKMQGWVERICAGDDSAWTAFLVQFRERMERLTHSMLRRFPAVHGHAEADDILQNALIRLLRTVRELQPSSIEALFGLLAEQLRRELLDLARRFHRDRHNIVLGTSVPREDDVMPSSNLLACIDESDDIEQWFWFHEEVGRLPAIEREVVALTFYHGWTQAEVAELFHISERTVRRRWETALIKLGRALRERSL